MDTSERQRLWVMQLHLERKALTADGRIVRIPGTNPDPIPICAVTRFDQSYHWGFGHHAPSTIIDGVRHLSPEELFTGSPALEAIAAHHRLEHQVCRTYRFAPQSPTDPDVEVVHTAAEHIAIRIDEQEVSWASSARSNQQCAELWVYTHPDHRRDGYAYQAAQAWANVILRSERVAFYSYLTNNDASRQLAHRLDVTHLFDIATLAQSDEGI